MNATLAVSRGFGDLPHKKLLTDVLPHARRDEQMKSALLACPEVLRFQRKEYVWWLCTVWGGCVLCVVVVYTLKDRSQDMLGPFLRFTGYDV